MTDPNGSAMQLERTSSLPQLESVPSPPRILVSLPSSVPSSSSDGAASSTADVAEVPELHDELPRSFSGSLLHRLEGLGVSAYSTADVEQTVIARALQVEAQHSRQGPGAANQRRQAEQQASSSLKRKRIPKKPGTSIAASSGLSFSLLPPPPAIVHHDDPVTAAGTLAKKHLEDALAIRIKREQPPSAVPRSIPTRERSRAIDDQLPSGVTERQRLIDTGEVTPFHAMAGVEKGYRRVARPALPQREAAAVQPARRAALEEERQESSRRSSASSSQPRTPARSATPPLQSPAPANTGARVSSTPPPTGSGSSAASPPASPSSRSPSPALSVSELPARLTRSQIQQEVRNIELAVKRTQREEQGIKEEPLVIDDEDLAAQLDVLDGDEELALRREDDEEWKGDAESSEEEDDEQEDEDADFDDQRSTPPASRPPRPRPRRRLIKAADVEAEETAEIEQEEHLMDDDDDDSELPFSSLRQRFKDDFLDEDYEERLSAIRHSPAFVEEVRRVEGRDDSKHGDGEESLDVAFEGGYVLPGRIWDRLFGYQKTSVKWMWELHMQKAGGMVADEMGLGKTIQLVAFLAGLHYSQAIFKANHATSSSSLAQSPFQLPPHLILCPATIMTQWLREFHLWYPEMRVLVLHDSVQAQHGQSKEAVVDQLFTSGHVLITTYECARIYRHLLLPREWGYCVLDEGHKIRNPDAAITLTCKQLLSVHRMILTGAPIQNNLVELWSLFDFIFPGKLGTLPVFEDEFCFPINQGGYTNASATQVQLAYRCASVLRELINPYVLRRSKADVAQHLPKKTEQVLFVNLSPKQREVYKEILASDTVQETIDGRGSLFRAIHILRKVCNHPDLLLLKNAGEFSTKKVQPRDVQDYGAVERSGKLQVVQHILAVWHAEGHRVLLFTQTRQMLDILEQLVLGVYSYHRIDGLTSIKSRLPLIDSFNSDPSVFLFLLTTKAGGLGVNLTGADRVLLYDPDWNPSTDLQARERSWRIGQRKEVTVYRLIVRGTIEEKIYHRQIFKQFLTNKILTDPKQRRFFTRRDMKDLFNLDEGKGGETETARVFREVAHEVYTAEGAEEANDDSKKERTREGEAKASRSKRKRLKRAGASVESLPFDVEPWKEEESSYVSAPASSSPSSDRLLSLLFSKGGITSAMSHDSIMEGSSRAEKAIAETVAKKVAERAVEALKKSREEMRGQPLNAPTWTGRSGYQGGGGERKRFGTVSKAGMEQKRGREGRDGEKMRAYDDPSASSSSKLFDHHQAGFSRAEAASSSSSSSLSSSAVLARLKQRAEQGHVAVSSGLAAAQSLQAIEERDAHESFSPALAGLLDELHQYLAERKEGVSTQSLIEAFAARLNSDQDRYVFRQLLRQIAALDKQGTGEGKWKLKAGTGL